MTTLFIPNKYQFETQNTNNQILETISFNLRISLGFIQEERVESD